MAELMLAPVVTGDLPLMEEWFKDAETAKHLNGMVPLEAHFEMVKGLDSQVNWLAYEDETPVGFACLEYYADGSAAIAFMSRPDMRRRGYGTRVVLSTLAEARTAGMRAINAYVDSDNVACARTLAKAGFAVSSGPDEDGFFTYSIGLAG